MAVPVAALIALGQSAYQFAQGDKQKRMARELRESNYVPPSVREAVANSRMSANATAGPASLRSKERLSQSTATAINAARRAGGSPGEVQQAVADADARQKEIEKDIAISDATYRVDRRDDLNRNLQVQGNYERLSREALNAAKSALTGASMQNKFNAVSNLAEGAVHSYYDHLESKEGGQSWSPTARRAMSTNMDVSMRKPDIDPLTGEVLSGVRRRYGRHRYGITNPFDYQKYLRDVNATRFATGQ